MEYKKLEEVNKILNKTDIKGKDYVEVNERIKAFWKLCPEGKIETQILSLENGMCVIQAKVYENKTDTDLRATGIAYEKEGSTFINKTSYIENCETSAVGRALGNAGIGIDTSVSSAEEIQNAILQQEAEELNDKVTELEANTVYSLVLNSGRSLNKFLEYFKVKNTNELTKKQYVEALQKLKG